MIMTVFGSARNLVEVRQRVRVNPQAPRDRPEEQEPHSDSSYAMSRANEEPAGLAGDYDQVGQDWHRISRVLAKAGLRTDEGEQRCRDSEQQHLIADPGSVSPREKDQPCSPSYEADGAERELHPKSIEVIVPP